MAVLGPDSHDPHVTLLDRRATVLLAPLSRYALEQAYQSACYGKQEPTEMRARFQTGRTLRDFLVYLGPAGERGYYHAARLTGDHTLMPEGVVRFTGTDHDAFLLLVDEPCGQRGCNSVVSGAEAAILVAEAERALSKDTEAELERERIATFLRAVYEASTHGASDLMNRAIAAVEANDMADPTRVARVPTVILIDVPPNRGHTEGITR